MYLQRNSDLQLLYLTLIVIACLLSAVCVLFSTTVGEIGGIALCEKPLLKFVQKTSILQHRHQSIKRFTNKTER